MWTSEDGRTWSRLPNDPAVFGDTVTRDIDEIPRFGSVTRGGPGLVAVGAYAGSPVWTSEDGLTWSPVTDTGTTFGDDPFGSYDPYRLDAVAAGGPGLVAVGSGWISDHDSAATVWTSP